LTVSGGDQAIVGAVVDLSHALGLTVVAEGVETEEQLAELTSMGCDRAQGYLFARPGEPADLDYLLVPPSATL
jgi:EAL domain-containing protein (putative c-di-GMP-specific phosphodiesterase class I)